MQKLHLVGVNLTRDGLIFSDRRGSKSGSFLVPVDPALAALVAELVGDGSPDASPITSESVARPESALSVREIQARLRGGRSIAEIADAAGVSAAWIERFAPPVRAEQERIIARARASTYERARLGPSAEPLGRAVVRNLAAKGVRLSPQEFEDGWSSYLSLDHRWIVHHAHTHRGRAHTATWEFDEETGELVAGDRRSLDVGYVSPSARPSDEAEPTADPAAMPKQSSTQVEPPGRDQPARVAKPRAVTPEPGSDRDDRWADALDWLELNDVRRRPGTEDLSVGLLRLIEEVDEVEEVDDQGSEQTTVVQVASDESDDDLPSWLSDDQPLFGASESEGQTSGRSPAEPEPADPLEFLGDDEKGSGAGESQAARIHADPVSASDPIDSPEAAVHDRSSAPDEPDAGDEPISPESSAPEGHPPRRRNRPLRAR